MPPRRRTEYYSNEIILSIANNGAISSLVLLAITFFPKRVLAPATEKGDGETGVLLAAADRQRKVFHQKCENH
jgi:hypothetical protein